MCDLSLLRFISKISLQIDAFTVTQSELVSLDQSETSIILKTQLSDKGL